MFCVTLTSLSTMFCFDESITEDVDDIELWWQTWLVTSHVSLVCNFASDDSSLSVNRDEFNRSSSSFIADKLDVTLAVSSAPAAPSRTSPPAGTRSTSASALSPPGRSRAELNLTLHHNKTTQCELRKDGLNASYFQSQTSNRKHIVEMLCTTYLAETVVVNETQSLVKTSCVVPVISSHCAEFVPPRSRK